MRNYRQCNGMTRRQAIRVGALGAAGLTLGNYLQLAHAGEVRERGRATAAIFVELPGGPSHLDTFDLKPDAPTEIRGEFNPIATTVAGIQVSEHLPK
ncbi:MAG: DUF1501 domain-containing protein, partial [Planctomycetota bacterium]